MAEPILIAIVVRDNVITRVATAGVPVEFTTVEYDPDPHPDCDHIVVGGEIACVARALACDTAADNAFVMAAREAALAVERRARPVGLRLVP
jgi:hypothetical protein